MTLPTWYSTGTVSVESGSTTVTVADGFWGDDAIMPGDLLCDPAQPLVPPQRVKEVTGNSELELWAPWPGDDIEDGAYEIRYVGIIERSTAQTRKVLEQLGDVKAWYDIIVEDDDARLAMDTEGNPLRAGYRVLVRDDGVIWQKRTSAYGDWIGPVEFKGDKGDKGWTPVYGLVGDGERRVEQLIEWVGGAGTPPTASVGKYRGPAGLVDDIEDATDVRGPAGDIDGVTPFWQDRITNDADAADALTGLGVTPFWQGLVNVNSSQEEARAALDVPSTDDLVGVAETAGVGAALADYILGRKSSFCMAYRDANTAAIFANATLTDVPFDANAFDFNNWWDISTPANFYVPNLPNLIGVRITASLFADQPTGASCELRVTKNGNAAFPGNVLSARTGGAREMQYSSGVIPAQANDIFRLVFYQTSGAAMAVRANFTWLLIEAVFSPE